MPDKEHFLKTIADLESNMAERTAEHERYIRKTRSTINDLCEHAGLPAKYDLGADAVLSANASASAQSAAIVKPDEFYGKPLATAVKAALSTLRVSGRAPASLDAIYDVLLSGGFEFPSKSKDVAIQGLSVSIGKNSESFVKLNSGLIGLKEWYGQAPKRPRLNKPSTSSEASAADGSTAESAQTEATSDSAQSEEETP